MTKQILIDLIGLAGLGSISYGAWLIYEPSAFIIAGASVVVWASIASK